MSVFGLPPIDVSKTTIFIKGTTIDDKKTIREIITLWDFDVNDICKTVMDALRKKYGPEKSGRR